MSLFGKDGEMSAVLSRLSMGLEAIRRGMQQQQQTAAEAARAAVQCLPTLANQSDFFAAATPIPASTKGAAAATQQQQQQQNVQPASATAGVAEKSFASPTLGVSPSPEAAPPPLDKQEEAALQVDRRLWGPLPGSLLQLGFALRAALQRLTHDSFGSLCIHSLQLTLPSPCQLLKLPAVPATTRLLPTTAFRRTLTPEATYFLCCLAAAPLSPCVALDLVLTIKGLKNPGSSPIAEQLQQRKWHTHNFAAAPVTGLGSVIFNSNRVGGSPFDGRASKHWSFSGTHSQYNANHPHFFSPAAAATSVPLDRLGASGMQNDAALGSIKVAAPLLRLELLKRPRIPEDAVSSAQRAAHSTSPRIALSQTGGLPVKPKSKQPEATHNNNKGQPTLQQQAPSRQPNCVLEVLLKGLELTFVSGHQQTEGSLHSHRPANGWGGSRRAFGSAAFLSRPAAIDTEAAEGGPPKGSGEALPSPVRPFRVVLSLHDCIIQGEDGSRLLQNASVIPKLFSGEFSGGAGGGHSPQGQYTAAGGSSQPAAGNATPPGGGPAGVEGVGGPSGRRPPQKTRLAFRQALNSDVPLQDPLLQCLAWVSDGVVFVSAEMAHLRIQLRALQGANVYAWGMGLYGELQQLKHFRLQFPAISFGCCFSTASWLVPIGVNAQQLLRVAQLQNRGPSLPLSERGHTKYSKEEAEEQAVRRSLLLHRRGLGLLSLLYPALSPPALAPHNWNGELPLQLPEMVESMSIQRVLQVLQDDAAAAREAATNANADPTAAPAPWRLQTADLFQHHSDLQAGILQQPVRHLLFCLPLLADSAKIY